MYGLNPDDARDAAIEAHMRSIDFGIRMALDALRGCQTIDEARERISEMIGTQASVERLIGDDPDRVIRSG